MVNVWFISQTKSKVVRISFELKKKKKILTKSPHNDGKTPIWWKCLNKKVPNNVFVKMYMYNAQYTGIVKILVYIIFQWLCSYWYLVCRCSEVYRCAAVCYPNWCETSKCDNIKKPDESIREISGRVRNTLLSRYLFWVSN